MSTNNNNNEQGSETPERFRIKPVQSRKTSLANGVTFLEEDRNNVEDQSDMSSPPSSGKPSPSLGKVGRLFTKRQSVQLTHQKSLRHYLTRDKLPREDHYRNMTSFQRAGENHRPTLDELMDDSKNARRINIDGIAELDEDEQPEGTGALKFGWFEGVYMRCLLNIWGVMLFLRLTWVVGQAGIFEGIGVLVLSNVVTTITTISMSAVSTNGQIKAGGIYYMISRSLGPEFGGAIGLMFTVANSVAVSMYIIGFCESLVDMLYQYVAGFDGFISTNRVHDVRLIGSVTLVVILALAIVGMEWVTRVQKVLMLLLVFAQIDFIVGTFLTPTAEQYAKGFVGWDSKVASENLWSDYRPGKDGTTQTFFTVFSVFFPAVTGIVAGANLSGDLKDPAYSIPKGTLAAIGTTFVTYFIYLIMVGCVAVRFASGVVEEVGFGLPGANETYYELLNVTQPFNDCTDRFCDYGTAINQQMMELISAWGPLIYAGCFAATLSSAITSLEGAPRVLQALAKDKLYPYIETFSVGWGKNNDPIRGYIMVFGISLICILIGDLNVVSGLLSNFFVAAYALINFSVFHASITKSPGWRPGFKYYNKWVSLLGTVLCVVVMFLMDHVTALITFIIIIFLYVCVSVRKPEVNWGSSTQAQAFVTALKASQTLSKVNDHVKNYRPKIMVLSGDPSDRPSLIDFANLITKRLSLLSTTHIVKDTSIDWKVLEGNKNRSQQWLIANKIKAFHALTRNESFSDGVRSAIELQGLGKLSPNMMLCGFKENWKTSVADAEQYFDAIHAAMDMHLAVGILRITGGLDISEILCAEDKSALLARKESNQSIESTHSDDMSTSGKTSSIAMSVDSGLDIEHLSGTPNLSHRHTNKKPKMIIPNNLAKSNIDDETLDKMLPFRNKTEIEGTVDIYWLYDDGGLTLLIPHILHTRKKFAKCKLRLFFLCSKIDQLDDETRAMIALLAKFRIEADDVIIISDATKKPTNETKEAFEKILTAPKQKLSTGSQNSDTSDISKESDDPYIIPEEELLAHKEKTYFHLRISEVVKEYSSNASLLVMTLPVVRKGQVPPLLYMAWLDVLTRDMPPTLMVRGNQESVLTFYS